MLKSGQRARLIGYANGIDTILHVGKGGVSENTVIQASDALKARELIKAKVLDSSPVSSKEAAAELSEKTGSETVQVIGSKFVLYKRNPEKSAYAI